MAKAIDPSKKVCGFGGQARKHKTYEQLLLDDLLWVSDTFGHYSKRLTRNQNVLDLGAQHEDYFVQNPKAPDRTEPERTFLAWLKTEQGKQAVFAAQEKRKPKPTVREIVYEQGGCFGAAVCCPIM